MSRIRLLPEQVANQIAAGEVVERPASVVKELVENALDAGARRIQVDIQAGGRSLIRVVDDGMGMNRDDALLAFERHATSKIRQAEDLLQIRTMGFRGEALPSIASVSRLTLVTREHDPAAIEATQVVIHGGKIVDVRSASGPPGTSIEVRHLFYNLPARRKFLRSEETERTHIHHYLTLAALSSPEVGFTFTSNQRLVWQLAPVAADGSAFSLEALRERLRALYGAELPWVPVDFQTTIRLPAAWRPAPEEEGEDPAPGESPLRLRGFVGAPGVSRATRADMNWFVNRRPVENRMLSHALQEAYHTSLMKGRFPICCLFLEIHPALVDVNIHPAKREVKFRLEREVRALVTRAIKSALLWLAPAQPASGPTHSAEPKTDAVSTAPPPPSLRLDAETPRQPTPSEPSEPPEPRGLPLEAPSAGAAKPAAAGSGVSDLFVPATPPSAPRLPAVPEPSRQLTTTPGSGRPPEVPSAEPASLLTVPLRLLGVIGRLYVVLESDRGLVLMDQHAAHERVLFEQMLQRLEQGPAPCQRLLLPQTVELSARDATFLRQHLPVLSRLGVALSEFGERTFLLDGLPPFVRVKDPRAFVLEILDELRRSGEGVNPLRLGEEKVAKTVCRHAVKANDPLTGPELERLIDDLRRCAMPYTCPHGRPTLIEFSYRELEKRFGRITH